ncbi:large subunit ribosomal protein L31 [Klenkia marina]|uniref:50S ribosomal protein L31 n=1 Tax=Klenkia marina TaxID=1960309 RepID=A0A1G4YPZ2_9ACTN|nr:type B 50S ribosomal protein L31 [Klenkia marina]SCX55530.1 large subunit ribosomal protein L31 [Klenkia marina]
MRTGIHPTYRTVVFRDAATGTLIRTRSTIATDQTVELDGETLPLVAVDTSAASHPFWTGSARVLDTAGRVEKFNARYGQRDAARHGNRAR